MADLREKVVQDRGIIAKIQAMIPGFNGYRANEDLRAADNMLRLQLAGRLAAARAEVEAGRAALTESMDLQNLDRLGGAINQLKAAEGEVRSAGQGYSGISAKLRVGEGELNKLYDYDLSLLQGVASISGEATKVKALAAAGSPDLKAGLADLKSATDKFQADFEKRMKIITGTEV